MHYFNFYSKKKKKKLKETKKHMYKQWNANTF